MSDKNLDTLFEEAYERANNIDYPLPQDVMLRIYAYYKQATLAEAKPGMEPHELNLRDAFKVNAWMQVRHLSPDEAKRLYIETINSITK